MFVIAIIGISFIFSMSLGSEVGPGTVLAILINNTINKPLFDAGPLINETIIWQIRLPRALLAGITGAGLSLVGAVMQALVRNPMADPYLLGVSSGASLGAVLVILWGVSPIGPLSLPLISFVTALCPLAIIYFLTGRGKPLPTTSLILFGITLSMGLTAITQLLIFMAPNPTAIRGVLFWTLGSFGGAEIKNIWIPFALSIPAAIYLYHHAKVFDIINLGDDKARTLGIPISRFRLIALSLCTLITASLVSLAGSIGFIGLIIPHLCRKIIGPEHRRLLPSSAGIGAIFMVLVDGISRWLTAPQELPVGVMTALIGAPLFLHLMKRVSR